MKLRPQLLTLLTIALAVAGQCCAGVLYFTKPNCPPCHQMQPVIEQVKAAGIGVATYDTTAGGFDASVATQYGVTATPTTIVIDDRGKEIARYVGYTSADTIAKKAQESWIRWDFTPRQSYHDAIVRLGGGSGVYVVLDDGTHGILTAAHVGASTIEWLDGTTSRPSNERQDRYQHDVAFLALDGPHPGVQPLHIAQSGPRPGDTLEVCGYGGPRRDLRHYSGKVIDTNIDGHMKLSCVVAAGDSGDAILNSRPEVVSVVSAGEDGVWKNHEARAHPHTLVPRWTPVRDFLARVVEALGGRQAPPHGMRPAPDNYEHWYPPKSEPEPTPRFPEKQLEPVEPQLNPRPSQPIETPPLDPEPEPSCPNCPDGVCPIEPEQPSLRERVGDRIEQGREVAGVAAKVYPWVSWAGPIVGGGIAGLAGILVGRWQRKRQPPTPTGATGGAPDSGFQ